LKRLEAPVINYNDIDESEAENLYESLASRVTTDSLDEHKDELNKDSAGKFPSIRLIKADRISFGEPGASPDNLESNGKAPGFTFEGSDAYLAGSGEGASVNNLYLVSDDPLSACSDAASGDFTDPLASSPRRPSAASPIDIEEDLVFASLDAQPSAVPDIMQAARQTPFDGSTLGPPSPDGSIPPLPPLPPETDGHWRTVLLGGAWRRIDMAAIAPYRHCISGGGSAGGAAAVVVVAACLMPDRRRKDYAYIMDNLYLYLLSTMDHMVTEDYVLVYMCAAGASGGPSFHWLKAAYRMIDHKLRKSVKALLVVHPTLWVRTVVALTRPFISSKFYRKLRFVYSLEELNGAVPLDSITVPDAVMQTDIQLAARQKRRKPDLQGR